MRYVQRRLSGAPITELYPQAYCLILVDVASLWDTSSFSSLVQDLSGFAKTLSANRDLARFVHTGLAFTGDVRKKEVAFEKANQLRPVLPDEETSSVLSVEDIISSCNHLLNAKRDVDEIGRCPATCYLLALSHNKIDVEIPKECSCLWSADFEALEKKQVSVLPLMAKTMLSQMEQAIP